MAKAHVASAEELYAEGPEILDTGKRTQEKVKKGFFRKYWKQITAGVTIPTVSILGYFGLKNLIGKNYKNEGEEVQKVLHSGKKTEETTRTISLPDLATVKDDGWVYPNKVDKNYDFNDPKQITLAWIEAYNNKDADLIMGTQFFLENVQTADLYFNDFSQYKDMPREKVSKIIKERVKKEEEFDNYFEPFVKGTLDKEGFKKFKSLVEKYAKLYLKGQEFHPSEFKKYSEFKFHYIGNYNMDKLIRDNLRSLFDADIINTLKRYGIGVSDLYLVTFNQNPNATSYNPSDYKGFFLFKVNSRWFIYK